jgi:hypothetical protein
VRFQTRVPAALSPVLINLMVECDARRFAGCHRMSGASKGAPDIRTKLATADAY